MFERILVPLDGSKTAEMAVPYAVELAALFVCRITLVSVSEGGVDSSHLYSTYLISVAKKLRGQLKEWGASEQCDVRSEVLVGKPAREMLRFAREEKMGLIVMASRGSSGEGPWSLGNIAAKVLRATDRPILLVRIPASTFALQQKRLLRKILVPLDGSKPGEAALCYADRLAKITDAEVILIEVFEPVSVVGASGVSYTVRDDEAVRNALISYLDTVAQPVKKQGVKVSNVVVFGNAANQIMKYAEENSVDLIAISSRGRSGVGRWVFGSVADKILHTGDIAVLIVPAVEATCEAILAPR